MLFRSKKFAKFVVSQIVHATDDVLEFLLGSHEKHDETEPKEVDHEDASAPSPDMGDAAGGAGMGGPDMSGGAGMGAPAPAGAGPDMSGGAGMGGPDMGGGPDMATGGTGGMGAAPTGAPAGGAGGGMGAGTSGPMAGGGQKGMSPPPSDQNALMPPVGMGANKPNQQQPQQPM